MPTVDLYGQEQEYTGWPIVDSESKDKFLVCAVSSYTTLGTSIITLGEFDTEDEARPYFENLDRATQFTPCGVEIVVFLNGELADLYDNGPYLEDELTPDELVEGIRLGFL